MIRFDIFSIFPGMLGGYFGESMMKRARESRRVGIYLHDLREYAEGRHRQVDDTPYGGGPGMIMKPETFFRAAASLADGDWRSLRSRAHIILTSPAGKCWRHGNAVELSKKDWIVIFCGRYEGVDARVEEHLAHESISIGDYILTGGELPGMVIADSIVRLIPGVLGCERSPHEETFSSGLLEHPQYTRPQIYEGFEVPEVLSSGNHREITKWQRRESLLRTKRRRPDLLSKALLSSEDFHALESQDDAEQ